MTDPDFEYVDQDGTRWQRRSTSSTWSASVAFVPPKLPASSTLFSMFLDLLFLATLTWAVFAGDAEPLLKVVFLKVLFIVYDIIVLMWKGWRASR